MDIRHDQKLMSTTKHTELMLQCLHHLRLSYKHTTTCNEINLISYKSIKDNSSLPTDHLWDSSQLLHISYRITIYPYNSATVIIQKLLYKHFDTPIPRYEKIFFKNSSPKMFLSVFDLTFRRSQAGTASVLFEDVSIFCRYTTLHPSRKIVGLTDRPTKDFKHHQLAPPVGN